MQKITSKKVAQKLLQNISKVAFCNENCSKLAEVARKNKNVFGLKQIVQQK